MTYARVHVGLTVPVDDATIATLVAAAALPDAERLAVVAGLIDAGKFRDIAPGSIVPLDDIPAISRPWLLEQGQITIEPVIDEATWRDLGRPDAADHGEEHTA